jgi:hypothetical protein
LTILQARIDDVAGQIRLPGGRAAELILSGDEDWKICNFKGKQS